MCEKEEYNEEYVLQWSLLMGTFMTIGHLEEVHIQGIQGDKTQRTQTYNQDLIYFAFWKVEEVLI